MMTHFSEPLFKHGSKVINTSRYRTLNLGEIAPLTHHWTSRLFPLEVIKVVLECAQILVSVKFFMMTKKIEEVTMLPRLMVVFSVMVALS